jgi:four helix bundle protein
MKTLNLFKFELNQVARELSKAAWKIFIILPKQIQYGTGDQFLSSADSVQANIAEGHGRFHYKDKMKFEFNARGSLYEALSWSQILFERALISQSDYDQFSELCIRVSFMLNAHIRYLNSQANIPTK